MTLSSSPWPIGWAIAIGLARVMIAVHYLSDVIAGWSIGFIIDLILRHRL
jgi:membrane-associated phospholipid phosphatase